MLLDLAPVRQGRFANSRSFAGLMDLYEQNYIRLRQLAPDLLFANEMISSVPGHHDLYMTITRRCKYTTMLQLTYRFESEGRFLFEPDLHVIVYHDARVVEVQQMFSRSRGRLYMTDLIEKKWTMNRFLYKWLGYCHFQKHYFYPAPIVFDNNKKL